MRLCCFLFLLLRHEAEFTVNTVRTGQVCSLHHTVLPSSSHSLHHTVLPSSSHSLHHTVLPSSSHSLYSSAVCSAEVSGSKGRRNRACGCACCETVWVQEHSRAADQHHLPAAAGEEATDRLAGTAFIFLLHSSGHSGTTQQQECDCERRRCSDAGSECPGLPPARPCHTASTSEECFPRPLPHQCMYTFACN